MLDATDKLPAATVFTSPQEQVSLSELTAEGPILLLFYLFDWSST